MCVTGIRSSERSWRSWRLTLLASNKTKRKPTQNLFRGMSAHLDSISWRNPARILCLYWSFGPRNTFSFVRWHVVENTLFVVEYVAIFLSNEREPIVDLCGWKFFVFNLCKPDCKIHIDSSLSFHISILRRKIRLTFYVWNTISEKMILKWVMTLCWYFIKS